jgi:hypothetical protein
MGIRYYRDLQGILKHLLLPYTYLTATTSFTQLASPTRLGIRGTQRYRSCEQSLLELEGARQSID